jgi:hypothetical protein
MSLGGHSDWDYVLAWIGLPQLSLHGISAVLAFACIAVVIFWYSDSTLSVLKDTQPALYRRFRMAYFLIGAFMGVAIALSIYLHYAHGQQGSYILAAEWAGIWAFAAYWFVKNRELTEVAKVLKSREAEMRPRHLDMKELADKL